MTDRAVAAALLSPLVLAIAFSVVRMAGSLGVVPKDADYVAARKILDDNGYDRDTDALVILPPWSLRPLRALGDLDPISGDHIADKPLHRYAHLWAVVEDGADKEHAPLVARRGAPAFSRPAGSGRVVVERYDLPPPSVLYDLSAHLDDATVSVVVGSVARVGGAGGADAGAGGAGGADVTPCARAVRGGVACGPEGWQRVTREWLLVSENADFAVWSHPPKTGRLEISWPDVPIGSAVVVQAGFLREGADAAKAPVRLKVKIDGEVVGTVTRAPAFSFYTDVVDTTRLKGHTAALTIAIDSDDNASAHFAWDATVVR